MEILFITDDISLKLSSDNANRIETLPSKNLDIEKIESFGAVVIDSRIPETKKIFRSIRQSPSEKIALKPVFIFSPEKIKDVELSFLADEEINSLELTKIVSHSNNISNLASDLKDVKHENFLTSVMLKVLRFLYTRSIQLKPMLLPTYRYGYIYPFVASQFPDNDDFRIYETLARMEQEGLLIGIFHDRLHLCNKCHSAFMNFREICPSCRSANLSVENVIHHFSCGYTAQESNFVNGENLLCPK